LRAISEQLLQLAAPHPHYSASAMADQPALANPAAHRLTYDYFELVAPG
jgi:hypothetical protein